MHFVSTAWLKYIDDALDGDFLSSYSYFCGFGICVGIGDVWNVNLCNGMIVKDDGLFVVNVRFVFVVWPLIIRQSASND